MLSQATNVLGTVLKRPAALRTAINPAVTGVSAKQHGTSETNRDLPAKLQLETPTNREAAEATPKVWKPRWQPRWHGFWGREQGEQEDRRAERAVEVRGAAAAAAVLAATTTTPTTANTTTMTRKAAARPRGAKPAARAERVGATMTTKRPTRSRPPRLGTPRQHSTSWWRTLRLCTSRQSRTRRLRRQSSGIQRRDDAKAELETAKARQTAARQEARNPAEKQTIIHQQLRRLNTKLGKAYTRAEEAYHEIAAAEVRQEEARRVYHETAAKIEALQAQSDAIREAQRAEEAAATPPEQLLLEQMRLGSMAATLRTVYENPLLDNDTRAQMQSKQEEFELLIKGSEQVAAMLVRAQATIEANRKKQEEEAQAAAAALEARQQFHRATTGSPPQPAPTATLPTSTTSPTTTATGTPAAAAATGGGSAGGREGETGADSDKNKEDKEEEEEEEDDEEDEDTSKDEKMDRGTKGPLQFSIADDGQSKRHKPSPTKDDILGTK